MKRFLGFLLAAALALAPVIANAGTLTVTAAGFSALPATPPANWPSDVTWPGGGAANGTKSYTISDADWIALLTWTASTQAQFRGTASGGGPGGGGTVTPSTPTPGQILLGWLGIWISGTKASVQQFMTVPAAPPAPISIQ